MTQDLRKKIIKSLITILTIGWGVTAILTPSVVYSQESVCKTFGQENCAKQIDTSGVKGEKAREGVENFILVIANTFMFFAALACVIFIIYGGFILLTSSDGANSQKKGRAFIINAIIGLIVILLAKLIVELTIGTLQGVLKG